MKTIVYPVNFLEEVRLFEIMYRSSSNHQLGEEKGLWEQILKKKNYKIGGKEGIDKDSKSYEQVNQGDGSLRRPTKNKQENQVAGGQVIDL